MTVYLPMRCPGNTYSPEAFVTVVTDTPVASWVRVTVTPGRTAPLSSATLPTMVPVSSWAEAAAGRTRSIAARATRSRRAGMGTPWTTVTTV